MSADTSGPAFPADEWRDSTDPLDRNPVKHLGMTLRDYFAAKAMQAMAGGTWPDSNERREIATRAYALADDMLKERSK